MATLTINTTGAQDARIAPALGYRLGLGRDATLAEAKQYLISVLTNVVQDYEHRQARIAAEAGAPPPITPT